MNKILNYIFVLLLIVFSFSCKKEEVNEITEFDISYSTSVMVPSNTISLNVPIDYTSPDVTTSSTSKLIENKTAQDLVEYIKLTKFNVSVDSGNMDFLKSLSIYIKAAGKGETLVATKTNIPTGISSLALDLQDVNIKDFIFQPNVQFRVTVSIDASTLNSQNLSLDNTVHVKATIIK